MSRIRVAAPAVVPRSSPNRRNRMRDPYVQPACGPALSGPLRDLTYPTGSYAMPSTDPATTRGPVDGRHPVEYPYPPYPVDPT